MKLHKVSIIIPVYNVEPYLVECLNSAVSQDYENIEIIAINDGSTDGSLTILKRFEAEYSNVIIKSIANKGQSVARNMGLEIAKGDYILFLDSDDWIEKNTVSLCMKKIKSSQADIVFFAAKAFCDGVDVSVLKNYNYDRTVEFKDKTLSSHSVFNNSIKQNNYIVSPCLYIFNKIKLNRVKFYPGIVHEDNLFTTQLLLENDKLQVTCIGDSLFNRRIRPESTMTQKKQMKHVHGYLTVAEVLAKNSLMKNDAEIGEALNKFVGSLVLNALKICPEVYGNRIPFHIRKRAIRIMLKINLKHLRVKVMLSCMCPDLLIMRGLFKEVRQVKLGS